MWEGQEEDWCLQASEEQCGSEQRGFQLTFGAENNSLGSTVLPHTKQVDIYRCA